MKKFLLSVTILAITSIVACTKLNDDVLDPAATSLSPETVKTWFESSGIKPDNKPGNKRGKGERFSNLEPIWKLAKKEQTTSGIECLEIPLKYTSETRWLTNLGKAGKKDLQISAPKLCMVVYLEKGEKVTTIKEIRLSDEYNRKYRGRIFKEKFSGKVFVWNWSGDLVGGSLYENGKRVGSISPVKSDENGRTNERICTTNTSCTWSAVCFDHPAMEYPIIYETTTIGVGSPCSYPEYGHGDGMFGCTPWEQTNSYSFVECTEVGDPGNPGEGSGPGEVDTFEGFPTSPVDGQRFTYTNPNGNSTTFTYNGQFNLWMMPEVTALKNQGFNLERIGTMPPHSTDKILTASVLSIALVEPTQIGKIMLATTGAIIAGLYIYNQLTVIDYLRENPNTEHCISLYTKCATNTPSSPCSTCLQFCNTQGYWDFYNCPNVNLVQ